MGDSDPKSKKQDPRVERLRPDPSKPALRTRALAGLWGDSDRAGFARLYLTRDLSVYAEFRADDVIVTTEIPPERAPLLGELATRIELPHDANVEITRSKRAAEINEFDLDIRFGAGIRFASAGYASSGPDECYKADEDTVWPCGHTCDPFLCKTFIGPGGGRCPDGGPGPRGTDGCPTDTCNTCDTYCGNCPTEYGQTDCGTCDTQVGHTNCGTCYTDLGQTNCGGCERRRRR